MNLHKNLELHKLIHRKATHHFTFELLFNLLFASRRLDVVPEEVENLLSFSGVKLYNV